MIARMRPRPAVFIERDGILNEVSLQGRHFTTPLTFADFRMKLDAVEPLQRLRTGGFLLIVTSNQPGLSRGHLSRRELDLMHQFLRAKFPVDDILICPHEEVDRCPCRKPRPGLLKEAAFQWKIDLPHSYVIGTTWQDAEVAMAAGCTSLLIDSPWIGNTHHDCLVSDLGSAVEKIFSLRQRYQFASL